MAVTLLGPDAMQPLLAARGRVLLVNRTAALDEVVIVAAAVVRHPATGTPQHDAAYGLEVGADESVAFDASVPATDTPEAVEVLLRLRIGAEAQMADAYVVARRSIEEPDVPFEVGVRAHDGVLENGETLVPEFAALAVYALPVS